MIFIDLASTSGYGLTVATSEAPVRSRCAERCPIPKKAMIHCEECVR